MALSENIRFIELVEELKSKGLLDGYTHLAKILETNKAGISDIKQGRKKISIEIIRRMKLSYPDINTEWIIIGKGDMFMSASTSENDYSIYMINKIESQAKEIGRLQERIRQLELNNG